jgi:hypothetical protein
VETRKSREMQNKLDEFILVIFSNLFQKKTPTKIKHNTNKEKKEKKEIEHL